MAERLYLDRQETEPARSQPGAGEERLYLDRQETEPASQPGASQPARSQPEPARSQPASQEPWRRGWRRAVRSGTLWAPQGPASRWGRSSSPWSCSSCGCRRPAGSSGCTCCRWVRPSRGDTALHGDTSLSLIHFTFIDTLHFHGDTALSRGHCTSWGYCTFIDTLHFHCHTSLSLIHFTFIATLHYH